MIVQKSSFEYPRNDDDYYLSFYKNQFTSVFIATNPFLNLPDLPLNASGDWIPDEVSEIAKARGTGVGVSWQDIARFCDFPSISHVNRALRLTGSRGIKIELANADDTHKMLKICEKRNIFIPDEGCFSPVTELTIAHFLGKLGYEDVIGAGHFGSPIKRIEIKTLLHPDVSAPPGLYAQDQSVYLSTYIDYHYFLVCQTAASRALANPADYFDGFFATSETNDFWGIGDFWH